MAKGAEYWKEAQDVTYHPLTGRCGGATLAVPSQRYSSLLMGSAMSVIDTSKILGFSAMVANAVDALEPASQKLPVKDFSAYKDLVQNALFLRAELFRQFSDPRRDIYAECGYPYNDAFGADKYFQLYDREPIARRVCEVLPKESWEQTPLVYESHDPNTVTEFEEAWDQLSVSLRGGQSWHKDEEGSPVWEHLMRLDILSGIGTYGVMLIGIDDGGQLQDPVSGFPGDGGSTTPGGASQDIYGGQLPQQPQLGITGTDAQYFDTQLIPYGTKRSGKGKRKLLFLRCFPEHLCQVVQYEMNTYSPRFGMPVMYLITLNDPRQPHTGVGLPLASLRVHWSRVLHVADNRSTSEIFGTPRMRPVLNRLLDLNKLYGGSAEMYWRGAFPGISLETQPSLGGDVNIDVPGLQAQMEQYTNGLQRYLMLMGITAKTLSPQVSDPASHIDKQLEAICIHLACPVRIFKGSERGELASAQDDSAWNGVKTSRRRMHITPELVVPFADRLIMMRVLPEPEQYFVDWPSPESLSEKDRVGIAAQRTTMLGQYISTGVGELMAPMDYLVRELKYSEEEAEAILDNAKEEAKKYPKLQAPQGGKGDPPGGGKPPGGGGKPPDGGKPPPTDNIAINDADCDWKTIHGQHVCLRDGVIVKGPAVLRQFFGQKYEPKVHSVHLKAATLKDKATAKESKAKEKAAAVAVKVKEKEEKAAAKVKEKADKLKAKADTKAAKGKEKADAKAAKLKEKAAAKKPVKGKAPGSAVEVKLGLAASAKESEERRAYLEKAVVHPDAFKELGGGIHSSYIVDMGRGMKGVWKPSDIEDGNKNEGGAHDRESAASDVANALGMHGTVPATVARSMDTPRRGGKASVSRVGSVQEFVPGAKTGKELAGEHAALHKSNPVEFSRQVFGNKEDLARAAMFDVLIGSGDRHAGNWLAKDGKLTLIDNGAAFGTARPGVSFGFLHNEAVRQNLPVPQAIRDAKWGDVSKTLAGRGISDKEIGRMKERFDLLRSSKTFGDTVKRG